MAHRQPEHHPFADSGWPPCQEYAVHLRFHCGWLLPRGISCGWCGLRRSWLRGATFFRWFGAIHGGIIGCCHCGLQALDQSGLQAGAFNSPRLQFVPQVLLPTETPVCKECSFNIGGGSACAEVTRQARLVGSGACATQTCTFIFLTSSSVTIPAYATLRKQLQLDSKTHERKPRPGLTLQSRWGDYLGSAYTPTCDKKAGRGSFGDVAKLPGI